LQRCTRTQPPFRITVVVGGADVETRAYLDGLAGKHGNMRVVYRDAPLRSGEARRLALSSIAASRCVLMENDTIVHPGWLPPLLDTAGRECPAVVMPLVRWHRGIHAAGCNFSLVTRDGITSLAHSIEYGTIRRKRIGYAETHCMLVDLEQLTHADLCERRRAGRRRPRTHTEREGLHRDLRAAVGGDLRCASADRSARRSALARSLEPDALDRESRSLRREVEPAL
jgi:hypothetical protein